MMYQFYIGGRCRGGYLHYSHCNVDVAILYYYGWTFVSWPATISYQCLMRQIINQ